MTLMGKTCSALARNSELQLIYVLNGISVWFLVPISRCKAFIEIRFRQVKQVPNCVFNIKLVRFVLNAGIVSYQ